MRTGKMKKLPVSGAIILAILLGVGLPDSQAALTKTLNVAIADIVSVEPVDYSSVPIPRGGFAEVKAIISPAGKNDLRLEWEVMETDPGVLVDINSYENICKVIAQPESEIGWVILQVNLVIGEGEGKTILATEKRKVRVDCPCSGGTCSESPFQLASVDINMSLGMAPNGNPAGTLFIKSEANTSDLGTPKLLKVSALSREVEVLYQNGFIKQVLAPRKFVDVVWDGVSSQYTVTIYPRRAAGAKVNGYYTLEPGSYPHVSRRIEYVSGDQVSLNINEDRVRDNVTTTSTYIYSWNGGKWSVLSKAGLQVTRRIPDPNNPGFEYESLEDGLGIVASNARINYIEFPWGKVEATRIEGPDVADLTTSSEYDANGRLTKRTHADDSWVTYEYDAVGRTTKERRPWLDLSPEAPDNQVRVISYDYALRGQDVGRIRDSHRPRMVTETIQGVIAAKTYYVYRNDDDIDRTEIEERCTDSNKPYGDPSNERTVRVFFKSVDGDIKSGRLKRVEYPDGRVENHSYVTGAYNPDIEDREQAFTAGPGTDIKEIVVHGVMGSEAGIALKTVRETHVYDRYGKALLEKKHVYTGSGYARLLWKEYKYDEDEDRPTMTLREDGAKTDSAWDCCNKLTETDSRGLTTRYAYDGLNRLTGKTQVGAGNPDIGAEYTYDGAGRVTQESVTAGGLTKVASKVYDLAGRLVSSTDPVGLETTYGYALTEQGRQETVTRPGGSTEVTLRYRDGRVKSVTGTGVVPRYYEYGVNADGSQWTKVITGSPASSRRELTVTDLLERTIRVERPGFGGTTEVSVNQYNDRGLLAMTTTPGKAATLYEYDELGQLVRSGLDVNGNGTLEPASSDRITETEELFVKDEVGWWRKTARKVYAQDNDQSTTVSTRYELQTGLGVVVDYPGVTGTLQSETKTVDAGGVITLERLAIDRYNKTDYRIVDHPDSEIDELSRSVGGRLLFVRGNTGHETSYGYDALGRRTSVTDPRTGTTLTGYDASGRVVTVTDPVGRETKNVYDLLTGRRTAEEKWSVQKVLLAVTRYGYDTQGRVIHVWGDGTYPAWHEYDLYGQLWRLHTYRSGAGLNGESWPEGAGSGDVTSWEYDGASGLLNQKVDAEGRAVVYTYGPGGRLASRTWARTDGGGPLVTTYAYDGATSELTGINYSEGTPDVAYTYDRLGRQATVTDAVGSRTFSYDTQLRLQSEQVSGLIPAAITRSYDGLGRGAGFALGASYGVSYAYDGPDEDPNTSTTGRFSGVNWTISGQSGSAAYGYVPQSDLLASRTVGGAVTSYQYDATRDLVSRVGNAYNGNEISHYEYGYDDLSRRTQVLNGGSAFLQAGFNLYGYDMRNELTESARYLGTNPGDTSSPVPAEYRSYAYDPIGNRTTSTEATTGYSYTTNTLNQYQTVTAPEPAPSRTLAYDLDGNLVSWMEDAATRSYRYDGENRLISVEPQSPAEEDKKVAFLYDYLGRRVRKQVFTYSSGSWSLTNDARFIYDGWNLIQETDTSTQVTKSYIWGLDLSGSLQGTGGIGGLLAMVDSSGSHSYFFDANGNVGQMVNSTDGSLAAHYEYDPYGNAIVSTGDLALANPYRFSTKYRDDDTGLIYYGYRYYDPRMGRWLSRDPIGELGGINLFVFVDNDPLNQYDVLGHQAQQPPDCVCCCANDVKIKDIRRIDNSTHWGTSFNVEIEIEFPKGPAKSVSTKYEDCQLIWKEKTDLPAIPGHQPNQWTDMYALYPQSPTFDPWQNKQVKPDQKTTVTINDPPALGKWPGRNATRTLEFEIIIKSSSGPACQKKEVKVTAWQFLEMRNGQGVTEQFKTPAP